MRYSVSILKKRFLFVNFYIQSFSVIIGASTTFIASVLLVLGIKRNSTGLILPWIVINIADTFTGFCIFASRLASYRINIVPTKLVAAICYFALTLYFVISVFSYYQALRRQKRLSKEVLKSSLTLESGKTNDKSACSFTVCI